MGGLREAAVLRERRHRPPTARLPRSARGSTSSSTSSGRSADRIYYLAIPPSLFVPTVDQLARARFVGSGERRTVRARDRRKADRTRSRERQGDQRRHRQGLRRAADLPDRSLSRQGNRSEHPGPALCEQLPRAARQLSGTSITCRSRSPKRKASARERATTSRPGALRDMVQNHLLQLLALIAMEPPHSLDADVVRDEKLEVIQSLRPITGEDVDRFVVRGQYAAGTVDGKPVPGYREESGVSRILVHRNLRRAPALHRQLALGRRAVLPANRQAAAEARQRNRHPPEAGAADPVQRDAKSSSNRMC